MSPKRRATQPTPGGKEGRLKRGARADVAARSGGGSGRSPGNGKKRVPEEAAGATVDWSTLDDDLANGAADLALRAFALRIAFGGTVAAQRREKSPEQRQAESDEYWSKVSPAKNHALVAEHRWLAAVRDGDACRRLIDGIASAAALKAAFDARAAVLLSQRIRAEAAWAVENFERPLADLLSREGEPNAEPTSSPAEETRKQALVNYVAAVKASGKEALAQLNEELQPDDDVAGRLERLLGCAEWWEKRGVLCDLSPSECVELFRKLLVTTAVYDRSRDALAKIVVLRKSGRAIQRAIQSLGYIVGLSQEQSDAFAVLLEILAPDGETEQRHHKKPNAVRVFTIDLIVSALLPHWKTKSSAIRMFEKEPRSTGIAALATAALNKTVTSGHVRDALKRWKRDKSNRLVV